ncbi:UNKNOWN [Stylonychia lemnae]|uniref:Uncharacterized protein n=1 Tax=Stylonychia lemnae TaxID=5949 RepID=A0A078AH13_STYLE|nr:UNKNOWN [Stylonychia lemnae]|eukprot:CDW80807.1 UNKNOWN [Stylonychia lemnae]
MGGTCCKATFDPNRVHIKKINEIFSNYLKNQGIDPKQGRGSDQLNSAMAESIDRHAKGSCRDLISLMQINKKFIQKICTVLCKRIQEPTYSNELKLLGLVLIRELILTPIKKREPRSRSSGGNAHRSVHNEYIFCISNEKQIFKILSETAQEQKQANSNAPFFIYESLLIFNILLTTLQKSKLPFSEDEFLEFLQPYLNYQDKDRDQRDQGHTTLQQLIQFETYKGFFKIVQQMKESNFKQKFQLIFKLTWSLILKAQLSIQQLKTMDSQQDSALNLDEIVLSEVPAIPSQLAVSRSIVSPDRNNLIDRQSQISHQNTSIQTQNMLNQIGFDILKHISMRVSTDTENEDLYQMFLLPIFEYFDTQDKWFSTRFAKFTFLTIIYNSKQNTSKDETNTLSVNNLIFENAQLVEANNQKQIDFNMLDYVLEYFLKFLALGIKQERIDSQSPKLNYKEVEKLVFIKRNLLEVFCEIMKLMTEDSNIRQFNGIRYLEEIYHLILYFSSYQIETALQYEIEKQIRIYSETYLSKINDSEQLINILDFFVASIQEEVLTQNNNQLLQLINESKVKNVLRLIEADLYFIQAYLDQSGDSGENQQSEGRSVQRRRSGIKFKKIKESHLILMINLATRCLDDGHSQLVETALLISVQMSQANQELGFTDLRSKSMSLDHVQRQLFSLTDFIKTDLESLNEDKGQYSLSIYEIWRQIIVSQDKNTEVHPLFYAFILHVQVFFQVSFINLECHLKTEYFQKIREQISNFTLLYLQHFCYSP